MQPRYYSSTFNAAALFRRPFIPNSKIFPIFSTITLNFSSNSIVDFYDVLGVDKNASTKDIKAAYYELSKKYHPDVGGGEQTGDARRFVQITEAYETLGNEDKRRIYDEQRLRSSKIFDSNNVQADMSDLDLQTLKEFQRKWDLRRRHHYDQSAHRAKTQFDAKHDEEFESFYRRYKENVAKARKWDETMASSARRQEPRREHYSEFQKEMLRKQYQKQSDQASTAYIFTVIALLTVTVLFAIGKT